MPQQEKRGEKAKPGKLPARAHAGAWPPSPVIAKPLIPGAKPGVAARRARGRKGTARESALILGPARVIHPTCPVPVAFARQLLSASSTTLRLRYFGRQHLVQPILDDTGIDIGNGHRPVAADNGRLKMHFRRINRLGQSSGNVWSRSRTFCLSHCSLAFVGFLEMGVSSLFGSGAFIRARSCAFVLRASRRVRSSHCWTARDLRPPGCRCAGRFPG